MDKEHIIKTINNEHLSNEELTELYWLLQKDQYKERPVTIQEFIKSDDFVHKKWPNIFPLWQDTLAELFPNPFIAPYNEVLISAAAGSGKTVTATISIIYDMYKLGCLKNPCTFYGLTPDTMIIMAIFSATGSTAAVNWAEVTTGIASCPWIMEKLVDKRGFEKKNGSITPVEIIPGIFIQTGSKFQHSMGKAIFDGLMDEAAFGGANMKDAQKSYNELSSRIKTRFATWGTKGNTPGHLFLISSPKEAGDFMQYRIEETRKADAKLTKVMQNIATWDADPRKDSDDKFTVFIGNENKEPCIYEPEDDIPIEEMDDLLYVPMRYYEEFKKDLLISIMNYGGIATTSDMALFKSPTAINDVIMLQNPFKSDVIELPFAKTDKSLSDFCNMDYFKNIRHPEHNRFIHIDAAFSTNTLDVYGLAASYAIFTDNSIYTGNQDEINTDDIYTKRDRMYFTDFAVGITAPKGQEVPLYKIQDFIEWLAKIGYPIASVSADTFQSKQTLQNLEVKGFETKSISVDRPPEGRDTYLFLKQLVYNKQLILPKNARLVTELKHLRDDGKHVDHPVGCGRGDTIIKMLDGKNKTLKELADMGADHEFWVYACKPDGTVVPAKAYNAHQTRIAKDLVKITLDNGKSVVFTPEHLFMLRNGQYVEAQNLQVGDSLMPLRWNKYKGYEIIWDNKTNKRQATHRMVYKYLNGDYNSSTHVIHHYDIDKRNNSPENLKLLKWEEHTQLHAYLNNLGKQKIEQRSQTFKNNYWNSPERQQEKRKCAKEYWNSIQGKQKKKELGEKLHQWYQTEDGKNCKQIQVSKWYITWNKKTNEEKQQIVEKFQASLTPEKRAILSQRGKDLNNTYWKSPEGKKRRAELTLTQWKDATQKFRDMKKEERIEIYNKICSNINYKQGLSYKHLAQLLGYKAKQSQRIARAIEENHPYDFKQSIKNAFKEHNLTWETAKKYFNCNGTILTYYLRKYNLEYLVKDHNFNHKVAKIEWLYDVNEPVYDITVPEYHNFALYNGVFVHNSTKDVADAVAGSVWNCAKSNNIINTAKVASQVFGGGITYTPERAASVEMLEFERIKQNMSQILKGL